MKSIEKLRKSFPQFEWEQENDNSSIFGTFNLPQVETRINNDLYKLNNVHVFISSKMGGTINNPRFRYAMCYQYGTMRPYRCKNISGVEYNKLFVSGKTLTEVVNKLINQIDLNSYYIQK